MELLRGLLVGAVVFLGMAVSVWVFAPLARGPIAARRDLGTLQLTLGSFVVVLFVTAAIAVPFAPLLRTVSPLARFTIAVLTTQVPLLLFVYVRAVLPGAASWDELGIRTLPARLVLGQGIKTALIGLLVLVGVAAALAPLGFRSNQNEEFAFLRQEGRLAFWMVMVMATCIAPIVEETFFRGYLFGLLRKRARARVAYPVASGLFAIVHIQPSLMSAPQAVAVFVGVFSLGVLLARTFERTGSLLPGMLAHALNNALTLSVWLWSQSGASRP